MANRVGHIRAPKVVQREYPVGRSRKGRAAWQTVPYPEQSVQTELRCGKDLLWSGLWQMEVRCDGEPAVPASAWEETCWVCDQDVEYLELEIELTLGLRVQRSIVHARDDRFLLLADAVLGERRGTLEYRASLPLCSGIEFRGAAETREGLLHGRKCRALVVPLALPERRCDLRVGDLGRTAGGLDLYQAVEGRRLFAPLFFDLDRRRMTHQVVWRPLTVAESFAVQPRDVAVGYRVAIGKQQWLIYRSLGPTASRSVLGHHLSTETLVARFRRSGEVEPLIEVE